MSLLSGKIAYRRYHVNDDLPNKVDMQALIQKGAFTGFSEAEDLREEVVGWTILGEPFGTDFNVTGFAGISVGHSDHYHFSIRIDRRTIPPLILQHETKKRCDEVMKRMGAERLARQERADIKDDVRRSLLNKTLPTSSTADIVWDRTKEELYVLAAGEAVNVAARTLFEKTFGVKTIPTDPMTMAQLALDKDKDGVAPFVDGTFLNWIWWLAYKDIKGHALANYEDPITLWVDDFIEFISHQCKQEATIRHGSVAESKETRAALRDGKRIAKCRIGVVHRDRQWGLTIDGDDLSVRSLQMPDVVTEEEAQDEREATQIIRASDLSEIQDILDGLYVEYIRTRADSAEWAKCTSAMHHLAVQED